MHPNMSHLPRERRRRTSLLFIVCSCVFVCGTVKPVKAETTQPVTYATWIMVWFGHDQGWWKPGDAGARVLVNGEWKTLDWADPMQVGHHLDAIKKAGVSVVIADLTNGWNWLDARCRQIQAMCGERGMKFCIAENSSGNTAQFESHARDVWNNFAAPETSHSATYFLYRGKPLIVCYAVRDWYNAYQKLAGPFRDRFALVWASGEDSDKDKWGWQLEPWVGCPPSSDSMYVTPALKWSSADGAMWRKSLAWMDYSFALAHQHKAQHVIVGSFDDPAERNSWLVSDTTSCSRATQIRDKTGALNPSAFYERVREWTSGRVSANAGGAIPDGAYRIADEDGSKYLRVSNGGKPGEAAVGAPVEWGDRPSNTNGLFWLYHQGRNAYRIIALRSGLALTAASDGRIVQDWEDTTATQKWVIRKASDEFFAIKGAAPELGTCLLPKSQPGNEADRLCRLEPVITLPESTAASALDR